MKNIWGAASAQEDEQSAKNLYLAHGRDSKRGRPGVKITVELKREGVTRKVPMNYAFLAGDKVKFHFETNFNAYVKIINVGSTGALQLLYPYRGGAEFVTKTKDYAIPQGGLWFEFDRNQGTEQLTFVFSSQRDETQILDMSWLRAQGVDIPDGRYDSAIVPIDAGVGGPERPWRSLILDDELYAIFSRMTAKGANVILISDSCHSGSLAKSLNVDDTPKFLDPETAIGAKLSGLPEAFGAEGGKAGPRDFQGRYLALTSSQDNQISIDSRYEGRRQGLFTYALKRVIQQAGASIGYQTTFNRLRELVNSSSQGIQSPSVDTRYYCGSLDDPIFSAPSPAPATASGSTRLHLIVRGRGGEAIANSSLALFKPDLTSVPKQIGPSDTLAILRTNGVGEATSAPLNISSGEYWVKVVCIGYVPFTGKVRLVDRGGVATLVVVLDPE